MMEGEVLKRMPAGYPTDFKYDEIMKHKDFLFCGQLAGRVLYGGRLDGSDLKAIRGVTAV